MWFLGQRKIQGLQDQQFEVSNLLLSLPAREFTTALEGLVKDPEADRITGGPIEALIEFLVTDEARSMYLFGSFNSLGKITALVSFRRGRRFSQLLDADLSCVYNTHFVPLRTEQTISLLLSPFLYSLSPLISLTYIALLTETIPLFKPSKYRMAVLLASIH